MTPQSGVVAGYPRTEAGKRLASIGEEFRWPRPDYAVLEAIRAIEDEAAAANIEARMDFVAQAQHIREQHDASHGEAEQCGGECIVLGLTDDDGGLDVERLSNALDVVFEQKWGVMASRTPGQTTIHAAYASDIAREYARSASIGTPADVGEETA